ncbi:hypothetical protein RvY_11878 [Ramazzottius varieornatus]|uniref:Uncharacterized protein n=1 Tax=Ramazzottius varieornatus TaxID=947166 RepID=A0A1D1VHI0_RAMVA|nr:hypothetical protein RvY_11878 [Ramazzottius varieornatus]
MDFLSREEYEIGYRNTVKTTPHTVHLGQLSSTNIHRVVLAVILLSVGTTLFVVLYTSPDAVNHNLVEYYGLTNIIFVLVAALPLIGFWGKMRTMVSQTTVVIDVHHALNPRHASAITLSGASDFHGADISRSKVLFTLTTSVIEVIGNVLFVIFQSICLYQATIRVIQPRSTSTDMAIVCCFWVTLMTGIASLVSMIHGTVVLFILTRRMSASFYPVIVRPVVQPEKNALFLR